MLKKKRAVDRVVGPLQIHETQEEQQQQRYARFPFIFANPPVRVVRVRSLLDRENSIGISTKLQRGQHKKRKHQAKTTKKEKEKKEKSKEGNIQNRRNLPKAVIVYHIILYIIDGALRGAGNQINNRRGMLRGIHVLRIISCCSSIQEFESHQEDSLFNCELYT